MLERELVRGRPVVTREIHMLGVPGVANEDGDRRLMKPHSHRLGPCQSAHKQHGSSGHSKLPSIVSETQIFYFYHLHVSHEEKNYDTLRTSCIDSNSL